MVCPHVLETTSQVFRDIEMTASSSSLPSLKIEASSKFEAAGAIAKIGLNQKPKNHSQVKLVKSLVRIQVLVFKMGIDLNTLCSMDSTSSHYRKLLISI